MYSKKFLSAVLVTMMATGMMAPAAMAEGTTPANNAVAADLANASSDLKTAAMRLSAFGIMEGSTTGNFDPTGELTRAQAAKIFLNASGNGKLVSKANNFKDVKATDWFAPYVNAADLVGIMKGSGSGAKRIFTPDGKITYGQMATVAVRALGYTDAEVSGTWPYNYMSKAMELGLFGNVENAVDANDVVDRADAALMVDQMLNTQTKAQATAVVNTGKVMLDQMYKKFVKNSDGKVATIALTKIDSMKVDATKATDLTLNDNQIKSNGVVYNVLQDDLKAKLEVGVTATVYVDAKTNNIITVENNNFKALADKKQVTTSADAAGLLVPYKDAAGAPQAYTIASDAAVYVNGKLADSITAGVGAIKAGANVTLIKTSTAANYDIVIVDYTQPGYLMKTDIKTDDASAIDGGIVFGSLNYFKKLDGTMATVVVKGAATKLSEIKAGDIVYKKATQQNDVITLEVVRNAAVTGTITKVNTVNSVKYYTINGADYTLATSFSNSTTMDLGVNGVFTVGKNNVIYAFALVSAPGTITVNGATYGYVTAVTDLPTQWGETLYQAKFKKADGTEVILTTGKDYTDPAKTDLGVLNTSIATNVLSYYTTDADGISKVLPADREIIQTPKVVSDTIIFQVDATGSKVLTRGVDIDVAKLSNIAKLPTLEEQKIYVANKNGEVNTWKDYYAIGLTAAQVAVVKPDMTTTTYGYVGAKAGEQVFTKADKTTVNVAVYNVFDNGVAKQVMFDRTNTVLGEKITAGNAFGLLKYDTNGLLIDALAVAVQPAGVVNAIEAGRINVGGTTYIVDTANVKVYNKKDGNYKVDLYSNIALQNTVEMVLDSTSGMVEEIILNK